MEHDQQNVSLFRGVEVSRGKKMAIHAYTSKDILILFKLLNYF